MWATSIVVVVAGFVTRWQCGSGKFTEYKSPVIALGCANTHTRTYIRIYPYIQTGTYTVRADTTHPQLYTHTPIMDIGCEYVWLDKRHRVHNESTLIRLTNKSYATL